MDENEKKKNEELKRVPRGRFSPTFTPGEGQYTERTRLKDSWRCNTCWDGSCTRYWCAIKALCTI